MVDGHRVVTSSNLHTILSLLPSRLWIGVLLCGVGQHCQIICGDTRVPVAFKKVSTKLLTLGTLVPLSVIQHQPTEASTMHYRAHVYASTHNCLSFSLLSFHNWWPIFIDVGADGHMGGSMADAQCHTDKSLQASCGLDSSLPYTKGLNSSQKFSCMSMKRMLAFFHPFLRHECFRSSVCTISPATWSPPAESLCESLCVEYGPAKLLSHISYHGVVLQFLRIFVAPCLWVLTLLLLHPCQMRLMYTLDSAFVVPSMPCPLGIIKFDHNSRTLKVVALFLALWHCQIQPTPGILAGQCPLHRLHTPRFLVCNQAVNPGVLGLCGSVIPGLPQSSCSTCCMPGVEDRGPRLITYHSHQCTSKGV